VSSWEECHWNSVNSWCKTSYSCWSEWFQVRCLLLHAISRCGFCFLFWKWINPDYLHILVLVRVETLLSTGPGIRHEVIFTAFWILSAWAFTVVLKLMRMVWHCVKIVYPMSASHFIPQQWTTFINQAWGSLCSSPYYQTVSLSSQSQYAVHMTWIFIPFIQHLLVNGIQKTRAKVLQWLDIGSDGDTYSIPETILQHIML